MKITATKRDVIVVLRHDPNSSDPVDVGMVLSTNFFNGVGITVPEDKLTEVAEAWAVLREIEFIRQEVNTIGEDGALDQRQIDWARDLTPDNFTKKTDLWFEAVVMPMLDYEVESPI